MAFRPRERRGMRTAKNHTLHGINFITMAVMAHSVAENARRSRDFRAAPEQGNRDSDEAFEESGPIPALV